VRAFQGRFSIPLRIAGTTRRRPVYLHRHAGFTQPAIEFLEPDDGDRECHRCEGQRRINGKEGRFGLSNQFPGQHGVQERPPVGSVHPHPSNLV
jgi:hypothetical protein